MSGAILVAVSFVKQGHFLPSLFEPLKTWIWIVFVVSIIALVRFACGWTIGERFCVKRDIYNNKRRRFRYKALPYLAAWSWLAQPAVDSPKPAGQSQIVPRPRFRAF